MRARIETEALGNSSHPAIFMVSGWAMPKEVMRPLALRLSRRFYVVMANLPGVSLNEEWIAGSKVGPNYDIDALSEQLIDVAPSDAWWLGWSLGGMVSVYVAARRSSQVLGVITLSASPSFIKRDQWIHGMSVEDFDAFAELVDQSPEQGQKRFVMLQAKGANNERALVKQLQGLLPVKTLNRTALVGGLRLLKSLDIRREWSLLDLPNFHLLGGKDVLVSAHALGQSMDQSIKQQTDVNPLQKCVVLPNCAHQSFIEEEDECVRQIEGFIYDNFYLCK